ncbi:MAG: class I SAM-dependent methyltransferase [Gaiellaceae bacterium]
MIGRLASVLHRSSERRTAVDRYWADWTVNSTPFGSAAESEEYLEWRFLAYPGFRELTGFWGDHTGETIVDYGCGPGNDVVGFLLYTGAAKVIGFDVSPKALGLAEQRIALHEVDPTRFRLEKVDDSPPVSLPLPSGSVDFVNCQGVLHHVSDPEGILAELRRVANPSARGVVMVYNRNSIYFHLYVAYMRMIDQGLFPGATVEEAFTASTDGPDCPIARAYRPPEFVELCGRAGFAATFAGAYFAEPELAWLREHLDDALASPALGAEHQAFLAALETDADGLPTFDGVRAGIGGVYHLVPA